jgi:ferric-dicitrate binding protein FerR (iron transport regulator)
MDDTLRSGMERYLAGGMTDAEAAAFFPSLRGDPEALAHLGRVLVQQAHLVDALRESSRAAAAPSLSRRLAVAGAVMRRTGWGGIAAAAAAVAAVVVAAVVLRPAAPPAPRPPAAERGTVSGAHVGTMLPSTPAGPVQDSTPPGTAAPAPLMAPHRATAPVPIPALAPLARLEIAEGPVYLITGSGRILAHAGQEIRPGQGVQSEGPEGRVAIVFPDASRLEPGVDSTVMLFAEGRGVNAFLSGGSVNVELAPAVGVPALALTTPHAEASGAGARFLLRCDPDGTRLEVAAGLLCFRRGADGLAIDVAAGQAAVVSEGVEFAVVPASAEAEPPGSVSRQPARATPATDVSLAPAVPPVPAVAAPTLAVAARLVRIQGEVRVHGAPGEPPLSARAGQALLAGRLVETVGEDAFAEIVCLDATRVELGANARAAFDTGGRRVVLDSGVLLADVAKQPRGASVVLATPHAEVKVLGTRFILSANPKATTVEVEEGTVRFSRRQDGASTVVLPGQYASVRGRDPVVARAVRTWRSWDVVMNPGEGLQAVVPDVSGRKAARLELYESGTDGGVDPGRRLALFTRGRHVDFGSNDRFNHADQYWSHEPKQYPYAGKSLVGRGEDVGERGAPLPLRVRDLQLHPPNSDRLTVAAFVAPVDGVYRVGGLGVRRVDARGGPVRCLVVDPQRRLVTELTATPDRAWVWEPRGFVLGTLQAGDRIHFAVARQGDYGWDAAEIAWTVTATE